MLTGSFALPKGGRVGKFQVCKVVHRGAHPDGCCQDVDALVHAVIAGGLRAEDWRALALSWGQRALAPWMKT